MSHLNPKQFALLLVARTTIAKGYQCLEPTVEPKWSPGEEHIDYDAPKSYSLYGGLRCLVIGDSVITWQRYKEHVYDKRHPLQEQSKCLRKVNLENGINDAVHWHGIVLVKVCKVTIIYVVFCVLRWFNGFLLICKGALGRHVLHHHLFLLVLS